MAKRQFTLTILATLLMLSACGGSSSGGNNQRPPGQPGPPAPPPTGPGAPLPIDPGNATAVLTLPAVFADNLVALSALVVDALILAAEQREAVVTIGCGSGSAELTLTDLNSNGLPSANEMATLAMTNCRFAGSTLTANGLLDLEIRSFVVESNLSAKAKIRVSANGPVALEANGVTHTASGAYELSYLGDDTIQTLDLSSRFADEIVLQTDAGEDETFSGFALMRTHSATGILTNTFSMDITSESLDGALNCRTTLDMHGPIGNVLAEGLYVCDGALQSSARALGTLGGNLQLGTDPDGDGFYDDVPTPAGGSGTWADLFSNEFFQLTVRTPGVIPSQLLATVSSISAAYNVNDLVLSPDGSRAYISNNNGIRAVNTADLAEIDFLALPATPGPLAISDDGSTLWVGFSGAQRIQSVDLGAFTAGPQVPLGASPNYASRLASHLRVAPGQPQTVVVSMTNRNELVAYASGVQLANIVDSAAVPSTFEFVSDSAIAGVDTDTTTTTVIKLDGSGLSLAADDTLSGFEVLSDTSIAADHWVYSTSGRAFDPVARVVHGRIKLNQIQDVLHRDAVVVDKSTDRVYLYNHNLGLLEGYGATSLVLKNAYEIGSSGSFVRLASAGDTFVLATNSQLVRFAAADLAPNRNSSLCIGFNLSGVIADKFFSEIDCGFNDAVYSAVNNRVYASMPSFAGINGNSIATIDPATGEIVSTLFVGSEPEAIALTRDESLLYVSFREASKVAVVDLTQNAVSAYIDLELAEGNNRPLLAADIAVSPTANDTFLVASRNEVAAYAAGSKRGSALTGFATVSDTYFKPGGTEALVQELNARLTRVTVTATGVTADSAANALVAARSLKYTDGKLYDRNGRVVNEATSAVLGSCQANSGAGTLLAEPSTGSDSIYYVDQSVESVVTTCDEATFAVTARRALPSFGETISVPKVLEEAGNEKLVLVTSDKLVMFDPTGLRSP